MNGKAKYVAGIEFRKLKRGARRAPFVADALPRFERKSQALRR